ncbi:MAG TPA: alkaline phosphatase family protein [Desulfobacterales bacterium]
MRYTPPAGKIILVLLDGLGDRAYAELNHRTPLQAAETPNLDRLASLGCNGLYHAGSPGQCLPSEVAHYYMFGYDARDFPGRGLLEAVGEGIAFEDADVLCLAHLVRIVPGENAWILDADRDEIAGTRAELGRVYAHIDRFEGEGIRARLHPTGRNDAILVLQGAVSPYISDSDPIRSGLPIARVVPLVPNPEARIAGQTARFVNRYLTFCRRRLSSPVASGHDRGPKPNFLVTQRCGRRKSVTSFRQRWGLQAMMLASGGVYLGIARELGMKARRFADGPDPGKDLQERVEAALSDEHCDFFHVHTKAPDHTAHNGTPADKRDVIAALDRGLEPLAAALSARSDLLVAVCADHSTPCSSVLIHSGEPVPVTLAGSGVRRDTVRKFSEIDAAGGALGDLRGAQLLAMLLNYSDRAAFFSHRLGAEETTYFPSVYPHFTDDPDA